MGVTDVGSKLAVRHYEPSLLQFLLVLHQGSLASVKPSLTGCKPLQLASKPGIDCFTVDLEVPIFLHHRSLLLANGE
jgi:hypothetical protein